MDEGRLTAWCAALAGESLEERRSELLARYLETRVDAALAEELERHVTGCQGCREALEGERLLASLKQPGRVVLACCPSSEEMLQYLERDAVMGPFRRLEIKTHLQKCELCRVEAAWAEKTVASAPPAAEPERTAAPWWSLRWVWGTAAAAAAVLVVAMIYPYQFGSKRFARYATVPDFSYEEVLAEFEKRHPEDSPRFQQAALKVKMGGYREGGAMLEDLRTKYAGDPSIAFFKGYIAVREGRWEDATALCVQAETSNLHGFRCFYLANVALKAGRLDIARRELQHARGHADYREQVERLERMVD